MLEVASLKNSESPNMKYSLCRVFLLSKETLFDCRKDKGKKLFAWNVISHRMLNSIGFLYVVPAQTWNFHLEVSWCLSVVTWRKNSKIEQVPIERRNWMPIELANLDTKTRNTSKASIIESCWELASL